MGYCLFGNILGNYSYHFCNQQKKLIIFCVYCLSALVYVCQFLNYLLSEGKIYVFRTIAHLKHPIKHLTLTLQITIYFFHFYTPNTILDTYPIMLHDCSS